MRTKNRGFTLIELLVVISIIGLLASIIFTSLQSAKNRAIVSAQIQSVDEVVKAIRLYYTDYGHWPNDINTDQDGFYPITSLAPKLVSAHYIPSISLGANVPIQVYYFRCTTADNPLQCNDAGQAANDVLFNTYCGSTEYGALLTFYPLNGPVPQYHILYSLDSSHTPLVNVICLEK
jgi:prepilin-type N-terminal cleavage/methylation domain-containing protein